MGREIKFRAWWAASRKMYEVSTLEFDRQRKITSIELIDSDGQHHLTEDAELMQFTERLDKDKREIYDGDFLGNEWGKYAVYWDRCGFVVRAEDGIRMDLGDFGCEHTQIIGNIYENIDLNWLRPNPVDN